MPNTPFRSPDIFSDITMPLFLISSIAIKIISPIPSYMTHREYTCTKLTSQNMKYFLKKRDILWLTLHSFFFFASFFFLLFIYLFFPFIFISWRLINLQYCSGFCHTLTWMGHGFTCVPHPDPPFHLPPHPIPLGLYFTFLKQSTSLKTIYSFFLYLWINMFKINRLSR